MPMMITILLALVLSLQGARASAAQDDEPLYARIADAVKVYEANWVLESSAAFPYSETLKNEMLFFDWNDGKHYVTARVLIHTTEEDAALSLKNENIRRQRMGEV